MITILKKKRSITSPIGYSILFMTFRDLIMPLNLLNYTRCNPTCQAPRSNEKSCADPPQF